MDLVHTIALKLMSRGTRQAYLLREQRRARPGGAARNLSILFSPRPEWEAPLRKGFAGLPHCLHFDDIAAADLERHDLIVPLSLDDARFLRRQPTEVRERVVPLPGDDCSALCHDKPRLNSFLIDAGFGAHIPAMGDSLAPPYISKPAAGENSTDCLLVADAAAERRLAAALARPDRFRQVAVPGAVEYATHFLMRKGALDRELTVRYHHDRPLFIKNGSASPAIRTLGQCPDATTLRAMLRAIGYEGLGCANYKMVDGQLQLIEINPRMGGSLCDYFFSFVRSLPQSRERRRASRAPSTWLHSLAAPESSFGGG